MHFLFGVTRNLVRNLAIVSTVLFGASLALRADTTCIGDCTPGSHLYGISGNEDVEAGDSGFDIYFRPGLPTFSSSDSSDKKNSNSSDDYFVSGGWGGAGALQFDSGSGSQGSDDNSNGNGDNKGKGDGKDSSLTQLFNAPGDGSGINCDPPSPGTDPTPEPRYSAIAMLGLGWALFGSYRIVKSRLSPAKAS